jgi:transcriptional regulator with XRE-family HTH domain
MITTFQTSSEVERTIAGSARAKRLSLNLSQQSLSNTSGVSYAVIKRFERTGKISLESLLKIAAALGRIDEFSKLFQLDETSTVLTIDDLVKQKTRRRGRK